VREQGPVMFKSNGRKSCEVTRGSNIKCCESGYRGVKCRRTDSVVTSERSATGSRKGMSCSFVWITPMWAANDSFFLSGGNRDFT
jgi:hypothetical protein